jgi:hypothetical protein
MLTTKRTDENWGEEVPSVCQINRFYITHCLWILTSPEIKTCTSFSWISWTILWSKHTPVWHAQLPRIQITGKCGNHRHFHIEITNWIQGERTVQYKWITPLLQGLKPKLVAFAFLTTPNPIRWRHLPFADPECPQSHGIPGLGNKR